MGYFLNKAFKVSKSKAPCKTITLTFVYSGDWSHIKFFRFRNDVVGNEKCRKVLYKFLTKAYMDLDCDVDGKYENDEGKRVFIKPCDVETYNYGMVWDELIRTGTTEQIELDDATLDVYLT